MAHWDGDTLGASETLCLGLWQSRSWFWGAAKGTGLGGGPGVRVGWGWVIPSLIASGRSRELLGA